MKLITLTLALAPLANGRLTRYARNSTSHGASGRCDRNVFERQFYDLAKGLKPTSDKVTAHSYETMYGLLCGNQPVCRVHDNSSLKSFLGDGAAVLARSSGEEPASPRHRAGVPSMA